MRYAIVDIETTGGGSAHHRIVEVAIVLVEHGRICEEFVSLCQPEMPIPPDVQWIHGITDSMVSGAPLFAELIPRMNALLENTVFVAHSVSFDYGFMQAEYRRAGFPFSLPKLCTVRLGRRLVPGLQSYSLARLCQAFSIRNEQAHRALSDARATAEIFLRFMENSGFGPLTQHFLSRKNKDRHLPAHLDSGSIQKLPATTGVYLFHDHNGKVLYVGKANSIRDRVLQHFSGHTHTREKTHFSDQVHHISFQESGHELMALLLENELIKKHFPRYNSTMKEFRMGGGIFMYEDRDGFLRLAAGEAGKWTRPLKVFRSQAEARLALLKFSLQHGLCLKMNQLLEKEVQSCQYETEAGIQCLLCCGNADSIAYNRLVKSSLEKWEEGRSLILEMPGRKEGETGLVYVENGKIRGFGFSERHESAASLKAILSDLQPYYDTRDSQTIIRPYLERAKEKTLLPEGIPVFSLT